MKSLMKNEASIIIKYSFDILDLNSFKKSN